MVALDSRPRLHEGKPFAGMTGRAWSRNDEGRPSAGVTSALSRWAATLRSQQERGNDGGALLPTSEHEHEKDVITVLQGPVEAVMGDPFLSIQQDLDYGI